MTTRCWPPGMKARHATRKEKSKMRELIVNIVAYAIVFGAIGGLYWSVASLVGYLFRK